MSKNEIQKEVSAGQYTHLETIQQVIQLEVQLNHDLQKNHILIKREPRP